MRITILAVAIALSVCLLVHFALERTVALENELLMQNELSQPNHFNDSVSMSVVSPDPSAAEVELDQPIPQHRRVQTATVGE